MPPSAAPPMASAAAALRHAPRRSARGCRGVGVGACCLLSSCDPVVGRSVGTRMRRRQARPHGSTCPVLRGSCWPVTSGRGVGHTDGDGASAVQVVDRLGCLGTRSDERRRSCGCDRDRGRQRCRDSKRVRRVVNRNPRVDRCNARPWRSHRRPGTFEPSRMDAERRRGLRSRRAAGTRPGRCVLLVDASGRSSGEVAAWFSTWLLVPGFGLVVIALGRFPTGARPAGWFGLAELVAISALAILTIAQ